MADRVSASIELGGTLSADHYEALAEIIVWEGLSIEWDGPTFEPHQREEGKMLTLHAHEVAGGTFDRLEARCVDLGLPFVRWCGGYPGSWGPERVVFVGDGLPRSFAADEEEQIVICREKIEQLGSYDAVVAYFDAADFRVPPLVVTG